MSPMILPGVGFYGAILACALPRRLVHVRVKQVLAGLLIALGVFMVALPTGIDGDIGPRVKAATLAALFVGAELMYTDHARLRPIGLAVMWIAVAGLVVLVLVFPPVYYA